MPPRRVRRQRKRRVARKGLKRASKPLYKAVKAIAKNEALKSQETKYLSEVTVPPTQLTNTLITKLGGGAQFLYKAIPQIQQNASSAAMIGQKLTLAGGRTKFHFNIKRGADVNIDCVVKLFLLYSKKVKSYQTASGGLAGGDLLRIGIQQEFDWNPNFVGSLTPPTYPLDTRIINQFIMNDLAWSGKVVTFRFTKNTGQMNFSSQVSPPVPGDVPNISAGLNTHEFVWNWGADHKSKVLKYEDFALSSTGYPTNFAPMWGAVCYFPDGTETYLDPSGNPIGTVTQMPIEVTATNQMFYKDG